MAAVTSALFVALFTSSWIFVPCQGTQELNVTVKAGEDAILQCRSRGGAAIEVLRWTRADLKSDDYILFCRDDGSMLLKECYRGRAEQRDPKLKDGDGSVILKNVNINDTGTYECWIKEGNKAGRSKRAAEPQLFNTIKLRVTEPSHTAGHEEGGDKERNVGLMVGLTVFAVFLVAVAVVGTFIFKKHRGKTDRPRGDKAEGKQLTQENRQNP